MSATITSVDPSTGADVVTAELVDAAAFVDACRTARAAQRAWAAVAPPRRRRGGEGERRRGGAQPHPRAPPGCR